MFKYFSLLRKKIEAHPERDALPSFHGTVLVKSGAVISWGINKTHQSSISIEYANHSRSAIHSEHDAIRKVKHKKDLKGCVAYNLRIDRNGNVCISKPCKACMRAFQDFGIKKCFFSTNEGFQVWSPKKES